MDIQSTLLLYTSLQDTGVGNGGARLILDLAVITAGGLEGHDNGHGVSIDLAEDDVAAVQPRGDDGGDEELRAVGVGAGVGHGQQTGAVVLQLEVLIGKLLAVDGLAASAVTAGEVTTLEHEVGDDSVERRALVAEALLASAELTEVLGGLGDNIVIEGEVDTTFLLLDVGGRLAVLEDGALPGDVEENSGVRHFGRL